MKEEDISDEELQVVNIYIKSNERLLKLNKMDAELSSYLDEIYSDKIRNILVNIKSYEYLIEIHFSYKA